MTIQIKIEEKTLKIKIKDKINEINNKDIIKLYCITNSLKSLEIKKGNEYEKAWIKIKYRTNTTVKEYINIFKIVRTPTFYEFIKYFKNINERFNEQNTETKTHLNDYFNNNDDISQEILITMVFTIETKKEDIEKESKKMLKLLKINNMHEEIFEIIEKEK